MPPPYRTEEIAAALVEEAGRAGVPVRKAEVVPDEAARVWSIRLVTATGEEQRLTFPFASARGIYTPREIASHVIGGTWPFG